MEFGIARHQFGCFSSHILWMQDLSLRRFSGPTKAPRLAVALLCAAGLSAPVRADPGPQSPPSASVAWQTSQPASAQDTLAARIAPPPGFVRQAADAGSFAAFLRGLPLKSHGEPVRLHTGAPKGRQDGHAAVIDIDTGSRDLQQCADAIMRLRAEWLWASGRSHEIAFNYTSGARVPFSRWARGERPSETGKSWRRGKPDASYASLRRYLMQVFAYAGTYSLARELKPVTGSTPEIGDVFIAGGFPGHAVLVADVAIEPASGARRFLLLQSYMPAQDMHVLKNPAARDGSPWYTAPVGVALVTPDWTFPADSLMRWP
ncbi:MAG: DUF4846 domain-containing protein [Hyphomicrobiaceae bacterium]|nr:DUF4846 domain-containing protein [Hyphomicrobiaceae bacterium]